MKHLFQETCIKTTLFMVFTGGAWHADGEKKTGGGGEKKTGGGGEKTGGGE